MGKRRADFLSNSSDPLWLLLCLLAHEREPRMSNQSDPSELQHLRKVLGKLSREERLVCIWKRAGFSTSDIAKHHGRSLESVDRIFTRARRKLRELLEGLEATPPIEARGKQLLGGYHLAKEPTKKKR